MSPSRRGLRQNLRGALLWKRTKALQLSKSGAPTTNTLGVAVQNEHTALIFGGLVTVPEPIVRYQVSLLEPAQISFAVCDPIDGGIDRRRDRIQEIQPERIADKDRRRTAVHHNSSSGSGG